ncbi:type II toxin-antitoxin system HicB family antitoxin [Laspinema palackyanum]|uniref:type II toxin-antitoxin system HicB family antitoxin n=1 Tax=Laspinema palackyanum TaxID=3231601 RepID=UPI003F664154
MNVLWSVCRSGASCATRMGLGYEEALNNAEKVLELLIESAIANGETLPEPKLFRRSLPIALSQ